MKNSLTAIAVQLLTAIAIQLLTATAVSAQIHLPMEVVNSRTEERCSHSWYEVHGSRMPISIPAAVGDGWRTDGYTSYIEVPVKNRIRPNALSVNMKDSCVQTLTISCWIAMETYPMMTEATKSPLRQYYANVLGNIDDSLHTGFTFELSNQGLLRFRCYSSGWHIQCDKNLDGGDLFLWWNQWHHLVATIDGYSQQVSLYDNGTLLARTGCMYDATLGEKDLLIGKCEKDIMSGMFPMSYFNGIIDEIEIESGIWPAERIGAAVAQHEVDFHVPIEAYAYDQCRPRYHGMPSQGWTNESHGLCYQDGRYHVFFQKNGNGPYMARLHWGHISSPDLCHWHEEVVAMAPDQTYDMKGCWSGAIVNDWEITNGENWALYSAIGNRESFNAEDPEIGSHCELMFARPKDAAMKYWDKLAQPGICCSFPDDFRDPYFFRHNDGAYIVAGCANNGLGLITLNKYLGKGEFGEPVWGPQSVFFSVGPLADAGNFWEMPNVTPMGGNRWIVTCTPMSTSYGVRCLYWTGWINDDGTFTPYPELYGENRTPETIELPGMAKDGFGLLSPSIMQKDGKTIALGIVPDRASSTLNYNLGYAHLYCFPREWYLDGEKHLCQRPYEGLAALHTPERVERENFTLAADSTMSLRPVEGRSVELCASFTVGKGVMGFRLLKNNYGAMKVYIDPEEETVTVDMSTIGRRANDIGVFDGIYTSKIPSGLPQGSECKLDVFFDHSILDIFVNDRYATSIRVFPYDYTANGCEAYTEGGDVEVKSLRAYGLGEIATYGQPTGFDEVLRDAKQADKVLIDGQVYIKQGETLYTVGGIKIDE